MTNRLLLFVICFAMAGCQFDHNSGGGILSRHKEPIVLDGTAEEMRLKLLQQIPVGTRIEKARSLLENEGFTCEDKESGDGPYLVCAQWQAEGSPVAIERRIVVRYDGGKVTDIEAKVLGMLAQPADTASASAG